MTEKRRSIASKLLILVVMLTLISFCFLGSTFARYTSGGDGTATMQVAKWDVSIDDSAETDVETNKLSPAQEAYTDTPRTHSTEKVLVATLTNGGEVDANVTFTFGDAKEVTLAAEASYSDPTEEEVKQVFSVALYYATTQEGAEGATLLTSGGAAAPLGAGETIYIFAEFTWTSDDESTFGADADVRDTWIGQNVESVSFTISYTAVQASELPSNP